MNKKQLIAMWVGIIAFLLPWVYVTSCGAYHFFFVRAHDYWRILIGWTIIATYVTVGLIVTFKDKKPKDEEEKE